MQVKSNAEFIRLPFVIKIFVLSIFEWLFYTGLHCTLLVNSLSASGEFCHLLIKFANILNLDQAQQKVRPEMDPKLMDILKVVLKDFFL